MTEEITARCEFCKDNKKVVSTFYGDIGVLITLECGHDIAYEFKRRFIE